FHSYIFYFYLHIVKLYANLFLIYNNMITKFIDELSKHIKSVEINGNTIISDGENIKIVELINKYSSVKKPTIKIQIDDKICKRDDKLTYSCPMCNSLSSILVGRFLAKKK